MEINQLNIKINELTDSINYYGSILQILKSSHSDKLEYLFIRYLIYLKKNKLIKLKLKLEELKTDKATIKL